MKSPCHYSKTINCNMEALPEHSTDTCLIVPKEEILDDLEITFEKEYQDDKYYIIPKEELCKSSLHLNGEDSSGFNHTPIKTELTLSDDVVQLRRDFNENTETENELVSTHKTVTKIKSEPDTDGSGSGDSAQTLDPRFYIKRTDNGAGADNSDDGTSQYKIKSERKTQNKIRCHRYRDKRKSNNDAANTSPKTISVDEENIKRREYDAQKSKRYIDKNRAANSMNLHTGYNNDIDIDTGSQHTYHVPIVPHDDRNNTILKLLLSDGGRINRVDDDEEPDFSDDDSHSEVDETKKRRSILNKIRCKRYRDKKKKKKEATVSLARTLSVEEEQEKIKRRREYDKQRSKRYRDKKRAKKVNLNTD